MSALDFPSRLDTYATLLQGTDEWHALRRGILTASVIGRLVTARHMTAVEHPCPACDAPAGEPCRSKRGGTAMKTAHDERTAAAVAARSTSPKVVELATGDDARGLTALLTAERITAHTDDVHVSFDMERGTLEEPIAREAYARHSGVDVEEIGFMVRSWGGGKIGYSPDGLVGDDGLIEIKSRRQKKHLVTVVSDEVPAENMAQIQAGLLVSGREWCDYVSYCGGMHLWTKRVYPDAAWFDALIAAAERFEREAQEITDAYFRGVAGMPETERLEMDMVI